MKVATTAVAFASMWLAATILPGQAAASTYPAKPVTLVVPYPPGGPIDAITRAVGAKLGERWKQAVNVENKPGGSEVIAAQLVSGAAPDGYTILVAGDSSVATNLFTFKKLAYDPVKDFAPVLRMASFNMAFVVPGDMSVGSMAEFLDHAKARPASLTFGSAGQGGPVQFSYTDLHRVTGVELNFIPYQGLAPIIVDMVGGRIDSTFGAIAPLLPHIESGKLKALALGGGSRSKALPDVPTFNELGLEGIDASFYIGLVVPAKTPRDIIDFLASEVRTVMRDPAFVAATIDPYAVELVADDPESFGAFLVQNRKQQAERVKISGYQPN